MNGAAMFHARVRRLEARVPMRTVLEKTGIADVLFTHAYHLAHDPKQWERGQPYPPLGTLYAAAAARERGYRVAVFDSMLEDPDTGFAHSLLRAQAARGHPLRR